MKNPGSLSISIKNLDEKNLLMRFKIIELDNVSFLNKNALNYGFLTTNKIRQHFITQVFQGEEGELILHNKRTYGILTGQISDSLNDTIICNLIDYNYHNMKLNINYEHTSKCINGCNLVITYEQRKISEKIPLTGCEYTILARFWNYTNYISPIIDIPFNEYIIGNFEKGSITHHYYSLNIPEDAEKIIIQIECNYLEGYYEEGRKKINTLKQNGNAKKLNIINEQNVISLNVAFLGLAGKTISLAFRPKDYYTDFFSYYYFRILYLQENEIIYYPLDSNFGNLCIPEYSTKTKLYYCHFILNNNYNDLSRNFSISQIIQNELYTIYITQVFKNNTIIEYSKKNEFISFDSSEDIDYYIFKFEFQNGELKNIISAFYIDKTALYPQIYSYQMFYEEQALFNLNLKDYYTLYYQQIYGEMNTITFTISDSRERYFSNTLKKPLSYSIDPKTTYITFIGLRTNIVSFMKLKYNKQQKVIEEIKSGEALNQLINEKNFPLYFYVKAKNTNYINIGISFKIIRQDNETELNNYELKGYILDEKTIQRKINGEYIILNSPINGQYSDTLKFGFLQINQNAVNNNNYILIEIKSLNKNDCESYFLVELVAKEYNQGTFFLPMNQYMFEKFDIENNDALTENKYYLNCQLDKEAIIDFSSGFDDISIKFDEALKLKIEDYDYYGFKRYKLSSCNNDNIYFSIINPNNRRNANYMLRYHYYNIYNFVQNYHLSEYEYLYSLDDEHKEVNIKYINDEKADICIIFDSINVTERNYNPLPVMSKDTIRFYINAFLFRINNTSEEIINSTSNLFNNEYLFKANTTHYYNIHSEPEKWNITFENFPRSHNFEYIMQLQIIAAHTDIILVTNNYYHENILIFTSKINSTEIGPDNNENNNINIIWSIVVVIILIIVIPLIIFFFIKYRRLNKNNINLEQEMKSLAYSNEVKKNVLIQAQILSEKDEESEASFI